MLLINLLNGDKVIWLISVFLACVSCLVVFSCSSSITSFIPHLFHLFTGFILMLMFSKTHYKYLTNGSILFFVCSVILLIIVLLKPIPDIEGVVDARRWVSIFGLNFQPSELAKFSLILLLGRNLSLLKHKDMDFISKFKHFYFPILIVVALIFKTNGSTALIILATSFIILFISDFKIKNIIKLSISSILIMALGVILLSNFSSNSRVETWENRLTSFFKGEDTYQVNVSKKAISSGKWNGLGPGKSVQKHFLPQASSDFVFAILVEEYSIIGGGVVILLYLFFLFRIITISLRIKSMFPYLLLLGLGILIVLQAFLNIGVSLGIMPVTGQTLPLISKGGSSIWITSIALGIILNISAQYQKELPT